LDKGRATRQVADKMEDAFWMHLKGSCGMAMQTDKGRNEDLQQGSKTMTETEGWLLGLAFWRGF